LKTLKLVSANLQSLENYEEAINYQTKTLKLCEELEDKINVYQQIANNFLQLGDHAQAIENQLMVYNLVRVISNGGNEDNLEDCEETE
jgi:tetratricopeptide (TPR) repeat protein